MQVLLAQLEVRTGDLRGNTDQILKVIREDGRFADVILFPELAVTGYNCGALFESMDFIDDAQKHADEIVKATTGTNATVIFGTPTYAGRADGMALHNSAYVAKGGEVAAVYHKALLARDSHHDDHHYFVPGRAVPQYFSIKGEVCTLLICEDIWADDHSINLVEQAKAQNPDLEHVFSINYSYFHFEKHEARKELLSKLARENAVNIFYLNAVGIGDIVKNIILYDGHSLVYRKDGKLIDWLPPFERHLALYDWADDIQPCYGEEARQTKFERIWEAMLYAQREIFNQIGLKKAQVHVSGGIDSAIVAVLCAKAMGPENCVFISNPSEFNGELTQGFAQCLADKLGVPMYWIPVGPYTYEALHQMQHAQLVGESVPADKEYDMPLFDLLQPRNPQFPKIVQSTLDAVGRTALGLGMSNFFKTGIVNTGNHTENVLGWFNFHDIGSSGVYQPIGDLIKENEITGLARWINEHYRDEIIPRSLYDGTTKAMAELADSTIDPFDYKLYSGICAELIRNRKSVKQLESDYDKRMLSFDYFSACDPYKYGKETFMDAVRDADARQKRSVFKCAQASPTLILSPRSRGFSSRETIFNHYKG